MTVAHAWGAGMNAGCGGGRGRARFRHDGKNAPVPGPPRLLLDPREFLREIPGEVHPDEIP